MKILFIAPTPFFSDRGCHTRILGEYLSLVKSGHKIELVTYHLGIDPDGVKIHRTPNIPWYKKIEAGPSYHKIYIDCLIFFKAFFRAIRFKPDIIHGHLHEGTLIGSITAIPHLLPILLKSSLKIPDLIDDCGNQFHISQNIFKK